MRAGREWLRILVAGVWLAAGLVGSVLALPKDPFTRGWVPVYEDEQEAWACPMYWTSSEPCDVIESPERPFGEFCTIHGQTISVPVKWVSP